MTDKTNQPTHTPARTYVNPGRVVTAVDKMGIDTGAGGKAVRYMIAKSPNGRYFPVFIKDVSGAVAAADRDMERGQGRRAAKKATKRSTGRKATKRGRKTLH